MRVIGFDPHSIMETITETIIDLAIVKRMVRETAIGAERTPSERTPAISSRLRRLTALPPPMTPLSSINAPYCALFEKDQQMKKPTHRTPRHKVNKRQKALAIRTLEKAIADPATPPYAAVTAARTLLNDGREVDADPIFNADPDAPKPCVTLPCNGRDADVRFGKYEEDQRVIIVPAGYPMEVMPESHYAGVPKPIGVAVRHRKRAEMLALPGPDEDEGE